ncbi:MAG: polysaccharide biosynthesis C-terminal domain-containing protein [Syntrophobacterales bacterium]
MSFWVGPDFAFHSTTVLQILAIGMLINSLANIPDAVIQSQGRPDLSAKLRLIELPFFLLLIYFSLKYYGIIGLALAWLVRITIDNGLIFWLARLLMPGEIEKPHVNKISIFLWSGTLIFATYFLALDVNLLRKIIFTPIIVLLFLGMVWRYFLNDSDKEIFSFLKQKLAGNSIKN